MNSVFLVMLALPLASFAAQAESLDDRLRACSKIESDAARLTCYDELTTARAAASPEPATAPEPVSGPEPVREREPVTEVVGPPPAPESLGAETLRQKDRGAEDKDEVEYAATVTRCSKRPDGRYVFYFSNGQVWKQSKNDRVYFRDCNFDVTITKDFFGYKMQQEGEKRRIRIKRLK